MDRQAEGGGVAHEGGDLAGRDVDVEVGLGADAGDRRAGGEQPLDQPQEGRALSRQVLQIVVVQEQDRVRVGGAGLLEGAGDVAVLTELRAPVAAAQAVAILGHRLVDDVPAGQLPAVSTGHDGDVVVEGGGAARRLDRLEPVLALRVPDQRMAVQAHAVGAGESGDTVRRIKAPAAVLRQDVLHLHLPLRRELGDLAASQGGPGQVIELAAHHGDPDRSRGQRLQRGGRRRRLDIRPAAGGEGEAREQDGATRYALLPLREKVGRGAARVRSLGGRVQGSALLRAQPGEAARPLIRQASPATFSHKGRRMP